MPADDPLLELTWGPSSSSLFTTAPPATRDSVDGARSFANSPSSSSIVVNVGTVGSDADPGVALGAICSAPLITTAGDALPTASAVLVPDGLGAIGCDLDFNL